MYTYRILIQFVSNDAPTMGEIMPVINRAKSFYNTKSCLARNPKKIIEITEVDDRTLMLRLESQVELPTPSKALARVFSGYLANPDIEGSLNKYLVNKQLFRMRSEPDAISTPQEKPKPAPIGKEATAKRFIEILFSEKDSDKELLERVKELLFENNA